ncbi:PDR/VanB family oxidoreductase [Pseudomonas sp. LS1212]|uniref:PDR/VanB family oxidoreductase n=1 Tax=Pseudomonas sp. LS1212 TaxID=2972478 RepID=UPI00215B8908|nr:PDR/VanB family oxidoreductase [Pseudomonas sp. LS1212]UVJ45658.1 PDR/VanB family oxidoreductase [Pseudomonas sp. LS1212]
MNRPSEGMDVLISAMRLEAEGVMSLELQAVAEQTLPEWEAGAHIDVRLPSGMTRQYSLCGDPLDRRHLRIAVLREEKGRGGSREVHDGLRVGQRINIGAPRNAFPLATADAYQFVAGGIGITPILPMILAAERAGIPWHLVYGGRSRRSMAFLERLLPHAGEHVEILPADEFGLLDLERIATRAAAGAETYSCGPGVLLDALTARFAEQELEQRLHLERFSAASVVAKEGEADLKVILARSGKEIDVPSNCSIMHALRAAGHDVPSSCEQGVCGMCETRVLDGVPDHRDMLLTDRERERNNVMMVCVSRAKTSTLLLDL